MKLAILLSIFVLANSKPYLGRNDPDFGVICPESEDGYAVYVPHPTECNLYYECVGLTPVLLSCPGDLFFDPALNVCNWPDQVDCHPKTEAPETTTTTTEKESTTAEEETTTAEEETTTAEEETTTAEEETTTAEEETTTTEEETTTAEEKTTTAEEETTTVKEETTTVVTETTTGEVETTTAAVVNKNETTKREKGDFPDFDVVCYESPDGLAVYVPHPTQCNLYYQCVGLTPFLLHCPDELFFDPSLNVCNWPNQVDCESQTEAPEKITTDATTVIEQETSKNTKKVFKRSIDPDFDVVCPESEDGTTVFVPHPTDCNLYYICVGKMPFLMQCPGDLYFDSVLNICNWPDLVNCETQITENPETTIDTSNTTTIDTSNTTTIDTSNTTTTYVQSSTNEVKTTTIS